MKGLGWTAERLFELLERRDYVTFDLETGDAPRTEGEFYVGEIAALPREEIHG